MPVTLCVKARYRVSKYLICVHDENSYPLSSWHANSSLISFILKHRFLLPSTSQPLSVKMKSMQKMVLCRASNIPSYRHFCPITPILSHPILFTHTHNHHQVQAQVRPPYQFITLRYARPSEQAPAIASGTDPSQDPSSWSRVAGRGPRVPPRRRRRPR